MSTTYQDVLDHLTAWKQISRGRAYQQARRAVLEAYRDIPLKASFSRYERKCTLVAVDEEDDGTIAYDHATQVVTLSGSTWPTNCVGKRIAVEDGIYPIAERLSNTTVRLMQNDNPGTDLAAGTTYRLVKDGWQLPSDFRRVVSVIDMENGWRLPVEARFSQNDSNFLQTMDSPGQPTNAYITGGGEWGGSTLYVSPPPTGDIKLSVVYDAQPKPLLIDTFTNGTVALTSGSTTATFTMDAGVALPATVSNGAILRISNNNQLPTGPLGTLDEKNQEVINPYSSEYVITERLSDTTVRLSEAAPATISGKQYTISDVVDMDEILLTALHRTAEANYIRMAMSTQEGYARLQAQADEYAMQALRFAKENDRKVTSENAVAMVVPMWRRPIGENVVIG
jgi:hypothetical protein